jgi:hypothetical protein
MIHELKTWPQYFRHIVSGSKTFEIRKLDREFKAGDHLRLMEYVPSGYAVYDNSSIGYYTGAFVTMKVTYVMLGGQFGIELGYCVMGIQPI